MIDRQWRARFWWCESDKRKPRKRKRKWHNHETYPPAKYRQWRETVGRRKMVVICK